MIHLILLGISLALLMLTEGDVIKMGGKPNKGTRKDKRLKENKGKGKPRPRPIRK